MSAIRNLLSIPSLKTEHLNQYTQACIELAAKDDVIEAAVDMALGIHSLFEEMAMDDSIDIGLSEQTIRRAYDDFRSKYLKLDGRS